MIQLKSFGLMKHEETNNYSPTLNSLFIISHQTLRSVYKGTIRYQGTIIAAMQVSEGSPKHGTHKQDVFKSTRTPKHCNMMIQLKLHGAFKWLLKAIKLKITGKVGKGGVKMVLTRLEKYIL